MKNLKKTKLDLKKIKLNTKNTEWTRGVYFALVISVVIFGLLCIYLFFKPISNDLKLIIDDEISSSDVRFNKSTLEMVKERQNPKETSEPSSGKNPFAPF